MPATRIKQSFVFLFGSKHPSVKTHLPFQPFQSLRGVAELASLRHPHNVSRATFASSVQLARSSRHARITYMMRCVLRKVQNKDFFQKKEKLSIYTYIVIWICILYLKICKKLKTVTLHYMQVTAYC